MKITILSQYFYPELISTGQLLTELAEDLVNLGCEVDVFAGQPTYYGRSLVDKKIEYRGITIHRVGNTQLSKNSISGKILNSLTFSIGVFVKALSSSRDSILLVVTNPPVLPMVASLLSIIGRQKYVCIIHDVYPDIAVKLGYLKKGGWIEWLWERMNRKVLRRSRAIVVLGRDMYEKIRQKLPSSEWGKIHYIPNWSDGDAIIPVPKDDNEFLKESGFVPSDFIVQYSGNMGLFHDMETIVEAAEKLRDLPIKFLLIGGGGKRGKIEAMTRSFGLQNVLFLPYQPKEMLRYSLSSSDVSLVCLEEGIEGLAVPCKYYGILASGRPVIALMSEDSEIAASVRESKCGFVIPQGDADALADKILFLFHHPDIASEMGRQGRDLLERKYSRNIVSHQYLDLLKMVRA